MSEKLTIVGVCGKIGAGKDTTADILVKEYGFTKKAFADKLKEACKIVFGFSHNQVYGSQKDKETVDSFWGFSPRTALQKTGTNAFRNVIGDDVWVKALQRDLPKTGKFVISDVRFQNEIDMIHSLGGEIWYIQRKKVSVWEYWYNRFLNMIGVNHSSEKIANRPELSDVVIDNTGGISELRTEIFIALGNYKGT